MNSPAFRRAVLLFVTTSIIACAPDTPTSISAPSSPALSEGLALGHVSSVTVEPSTSTLEVGQTRQLAATVTNNKGKTQPDRDVTWTSDDPQIATVSAAGLVTPVSEGGPISIRARTGGSKGVEGIASITVANARATLTWEPFFVVAAPEGIQGLDGSGPTDVWAACGFRCIFHFDGAAWTRLNVTIGQNVYRVAARTPSDRYFVGQPGTVLRHDGATLAQIVAHPGELFGVWAYGVNSGFACGDGVLLHFQNGQPFVKIPTGLPEIQASRFETGWGSSATDMYCAGARGVHHYDGTSVTHVVNMPGLNSIRGLSASDIWVAGIGGSLLHYSGTSWTTVDAGQGSTDLAAVFPLAANTVFLSHTNRVREFNGVSWSSHLLPAGYLVNGFALYAPSQNVVFVGATRTSDNASVVLRGTR